MAKLSLKLDDLHVTSFTPHGKEEGAKGTVQGQERLTYAFLCETYPCGRQIRTDEYTCEATCDDPIHTCGYCMEPETEFCQ